MPRRRKKARGWARAGGRSPSSPQACCGSLFTAWLVKVRKDMVTGKRARNYPHATQRERKFPRRENEENSNDFWMGGRGKIGLSIAILLLIFQANPPREEGQTGGSRSPQGAYDRFAVKFHVWSSPSRKLTHPDRSTSHAYSVHYFFIDKCSFRVAHKYEILEGS